MLQEEEQSPPRPWYAAVTVSLEKAFQSVLFRLCSREFRSPGFKLHRPLFSLLQERFSVEGFTACFWSHSAERQFESI